VPDDDLAVIYRGAFGFCMPSLYEGFGLPLLEAMASGIPSMSSNTSSLPEIGGDAAIYFNPLSEEEMAAALERLVSDSELRKALSDRGVERAKRFTWECCARKTLAAFERL
jgi:glycosyltransferase involved in cell wall biosynthesis